MKFGLHQYAGYEALARAVADEVAVRMQAAVNAGREASLVLSGGSTPRGVYELLSSTEYRSRIKWDKVHLFWGDERCVPPSSPDSNFRMAQESLVANIAIPDQNIHRMAGEKPPSEAARSYEEEIRKFFSLGARQFPVFDLILLGLGEDGHTASLFPGTSALSVKDRIVMDVYVEKLESHRVTLTFPALNNARHIFFVVEGKKKAGMLQRVLEETDNNFPSQRVRPATGELHWFVDEAAASELRS